MITRRQLVVCAIAAAVAAPVVAQAVPVVLNYNFNGIVHLGEDGMADDLNGFRSISDRALDFSFGVPSNPTLDKYDIVASPGVLDIVHLGNRNTVGGGLWAFDATADSDIVGVQPTWLPNPDQSGPQTSVIAAQQILPSTTVGFIYQVSNGGGNFDVTLTFASGGSMTETMYGPDWYLGPYPATDQVDTGSTGPNLSITETILDLSAYAGESVVEITFSNASNLYGGYAILGCSFFNEANHSPFGSGCYPINEHANWHYYFPSPAAAVAALDNKALVMLPNANGGYTSAITTGTFRHGNPANAIALGDNDDIALTLPVPFNFRGTTPVPTVYLCSDGFLSMGPGNGLPADFGPPFFTTINDGVIVAYGENLDPDNGNAGTISTDYDAATGIYYITFENVPHYPGNPTDAVVTFQYQLSLASGLCTIVYGDLIQGTSGQTDNIIIGESVPAATMDNSVNVTAGAIVDTYATERIADGVTLSADVPAISTATVGTDVTYMVEYAPDYAPSTAPGVKLGILIGSTQPLTSPHGVSLGSLNAPGCSTYLTSLDFVVALDSAGNATLSYPPGLPQLTTAHFQAAMLFDTTDPTYPASPAGINGNTFLMTSNALITTVNIK